MNLSQNSGPTRFHYGLLLLLVAASALEASSNYISSIKASGPIVAGDVFVGDEQRTRAWLEYRGAVAGGWQLALRLPTNTFTVGQSISAMVVYQNASTNRLKLFVASPGMPYLFSARVFDATNRELPLSDKALDEIEDGHPVLSRFREVAPGTSLAFPLQLDLVFAFKTPGTYRVRVNAHGPLIDAAAPPTTKVAEIRIVPEAPAPETNPAGKSSGKPATNPSESAGKN